MSVKRTFLRMIRYGMTGGLAAIVDLGVFSVLCPAFLRVAGAATVSFILAVIVNYFLTSRFVFKQDAGTGRFLKFVAFAIFGLALNVSVTVFFAYLTGWPPIVAKAMGIGIAFFFNFWVNTVFVFGARRSEATLARATE